jgi:hypothetical protein
MAAVLKFDQSGLPAGIDNRSRSDIVPGFPVTITNVSPGTNNSLKLLWKPPEDDSAVIGGASPAWTITPKIGTSGTYRFRLTVDGVTKERTFTTRTPILALVIPAANEKADPTASLEKNTDTEIDASETNEAFAPFTTGSAWGWWRANEQTIRILESLFHPTGGHTHKGSGATGPKISYNDLTDVPGSGTVRGEILSYTDTANKVIGPLGNTPIISDLKLWVIGGIAQEETVDYSIREVVGGAAPGYYICVSPSSTAPGGGTFSGGGNPTTGIDGQIQSGDKVITVYPV